VCDRCSFAGQHPDCPTCHGRHVVRREYVYGRQA
jgi:hypothetical protein